MITMKKPVILLAFANETPTDSGYLRNLRVEARQIRSALKSAESSDLCQVDVLTNTTIEDLLERIQDPTIKDEIAIIHFGGHANQFELLLENALGQSQTIHTTGLIPLFSKLKGLKLIFLNGCFAAPQAKALVEAGIPAVIGTVQAIRDDLAAALATQFYKGLALGVPLGAAWADSVQKILALEGEENTASLFVERGFQVNLGVQQFPWEIYYRKGYEQVRHFNLPEAAKNPYFGLPDPPYTKLPQQPYRFLSRYTKADSAVFFGRGKEIRDLFYRLTQPSSEPVICFFGQSGVGKSSLLDAGLIPRLSVEHDVYYVRRDPKTGLLSALMSTLDQSTTSDQLQLRDPNPVNNDHKADIQQLESTLPSLQGKARKQVEDIIQKLKHQVQANEAATAPAFGVREKWHKLEEKSDKAHVIIIIDQVEEAFTRPIKTLPNELPDFFHQLQHIFNDTNDRPKGRILLSYRKEFDPEISALARRYFLPYEKVFLDRLKRPGIIEVIKGLTTTDRLQNKYNLKIETGLPVMIANELASDKDSPVAPLLQIILTKLWQNQIQETSKVFSVEDFLRLREEGILLQDFFDQQMAKIQAWESEIHHQVAQSGLALNILHNHTTSRATSGSKSLKELHKLYSHQSEILEKLLQKFIDSYLLSSVSGDRLVLAHDTLAPIIRKATDESERPGQRARRILESKMIEYRYNPDFTILDPSELKTIEVGRSGMRVLVKAEEDLINKSRRRRNQMRILGWSAAALGLATLAFIVLNFFNMRRAERLNQLASLYADAARLTDEQLNPKAALESIKQAVLLDPNESSVLQLLHDIYSQNEFYSDSIKLNGQIEQIGWSANGDLIIASLLNQPRIAQIDLQTNSRSFIDLEGTYTELVFSSDRQKMFVSDETGNAGIYNTNGDLLFTLADKTKGHQSPITTATFSPSGDTIFTASRDRDYGIVMWGPNGVFLEKLSFHEEQVLALAASPDGKFLVSGDFNGVLNLTNLQTGNRIPLKGHRDRILSVDFSPDGNLLASSSRDKKIKIWNLLGEDIITFDEHQSRVNTIKFSPDGKYLLSASDDRTVKIFDVQAQELYKSYHGHQSFVGGISWSDGSNAFISGGSDSTLFIWQVESKPIQRFGPHGGEISDLVMTNEMSLWTVAQEDQTIFDWGNILEANGTPSNRGIQSDGGIKNLAISPDQSTWLTSGFDGQIFTWEAGQIRDTLAKHRGQINALAISPDGQYWLSGGQDQGILWSNQGDSLAAITGHQSWITQAKFHPIKPQIVTSSFDQWVKFWDFEGRLVDSLHARSGRLQDFAIHPKGDLLLTAGDNNQARLWNENGDLLKQFTLNKGNITGFKTINRVAFSPDGKCFLIGSEGGQARLYNLNGQPIQTFEDAGRKGISAIAFSADGQWIVIGQRDGFARVYPNLLEQWQQPQ